MGPNCPSLIVTSFTRDEKIILVGSIDALRLCHEGGYEAVDAGKTAWEFRRGRPRFDWQLRQFVAKAELSSFPLSSVDDPELYRLVERGIETRRLVGLKQLDPATIAGRPVDPTLEMRRLVRDIETKTHGKGRLSESGRSYLLVADLDLKSVPERDSYQVVSHDEARRVLDALASQQGATADLAALFGKARDKLTRDWQPGFGDPDGLILLRRLPVTRAPTANTGPSITPSQMRKLIEQATLEILVVDLGQTPQAGLAYSIQTPDGSVVAGTLDTKGRASAKSSTPGTFVVTFPDLDGADWDGDGALALPETERSLASKYKVEQGDRLPTIARDKGFFRWQTIWDFADNADLKALRGTAHILLPDDEVAIPSKLARKAEVPGGTAVYVVQSSAEVLRVCFLGVNSSAEDPVTFEATPDTGDAIFGTLPDDGKLEIDLPPDTTKVHVDLFRKSPSKANDDESNSDDDADSSDDAASDDAASDAASSDDEPFACYDFEVGGLDPAKEMSGIQARLLNLGFYQGDLSGELDDDTRDAITQFRWAKLRDRKDDMDDDFLTALNAAHGS